MAKLGNLWYLYLGANQLSGAIPAELGNLAELRVLYLPSNQLSGGVPVELGRLTHLFGLYLYANPLSGPLPGSLTNLHLSVFRFNDTSLCELPDAAFRLWLASIGELESTGAICKLHYLPTMMSFD